MLAVIRLLILAVVFVVVGVFGCLFCILRPFHRNNTALFSHVFGSMHKLLGLKVIIRNATHEPQAGPYVYIANHQNTYDIFTLSNSVVQGTVTIGKKSLKWVPFFGQLYWLAGNILIDRKNKGRAHGTIGTAAAAIRKRKLSILMFPEGTRNYGRGLLPFKTGAFHTAVQAEVPVAPVCMSTTHNQVKLNRWRNGTVIIEFLPPIDTAGLKKDEARTLMQAAHEQMNAKIAELDAEVASLDKDLERKK